MSRNSMPEGPDGVRRGYPVETPVGTMYLNPVGWGVLVDNASSIYPDRPDRPRLTYRHGTYSAAIGIRHDGSLERTFVKRWGSPSARDDAPPTHRTAILEAAAKAVADFREAHPELLARAVYDDARHEHERMLNKLSEAREALAVAQHRAEKAAKAQQAAAAELQKYS